MNDEDALAACKSMLDTLVMKMWHLVQDRPAATSAFEQWQGALELAMKYPRNQAAIDSANAHVDALIEELRKHEA